mmetsp:Transcript_12543/g.38853  ORF Transcript_12543/g.38853 Transcript_12543/m.38853 type:complete len:206 (+) Transcript_12543:2509-3126(+)
MASSPRPAIALDSRSAHAICCSSSATCRPGNPSPAMLRAASTERSSSSCSRRASASSSASICACAAAACSSSNASAATSASSRSIALASNVWSSSSPPRHVAGRLSTPLASRSCRCIGSASSSTEGAAAVAAAAAAAAEVAAASASFVFCSCRSRSRRSASSRALRAASTRRSISARRIAHSCSMALSRRTKSRVLPKHHSSCGT